MPCYQPGYGFYLCGYSNRQGRSHFISSRIQYLRLGDVVVPVPIPPPRPSQFLREQQDEFARFQTLLSPFSLLLHGREGERPRGQGFCGTLETVYSKASNIASTIRASKLLTSRNGPVIARQSLSGLYEFFTPPSVTCFCLFRCVTFTEVLQSC